MIFASEWCVYFPELGDMHPAVGSTADVHS